MCRLARVSHAVCSILANGNRRATCTQREACFSQGSSTKCWFQGSTKCGHRLLCGFDTPRKRQGPRKGLIDLLSCAIWRSVSSNSSSMCPSKGSESDGNGIFATCFVPTQFAPWSAYFSHAPPLVTGAARRFGPRSNGGGVEDRFCAPNVKDWHWAVAALSDSSGVSTAGTMVPGLNVVRKQADSIRVMK